MRVLRRAGPAVLQMERRILLIQVLGDRTDAYETKCGGAAEQCLHSCTNSLTATCASWLDTTAAREVRDQRKHKENYEHEEYQFRNTCGRDGYAGKAQDPRDQCYDQEY